MVLAGGTDKGLVLVLDEKRRNWHEWVSENKTLHLSSSSSSTFLYHQSTDTHAFICSGSPFNIFIFSFLLLSSVRALSLCIDTVSFIFIWGSPLQLPPFSVSHVIFKVCCFQPFQAVHLSFWGSSLPFLSSLACSCLLLFWVSKGRSGV